MHEELSNGGGPRIVREHEDYMAMILRRCVAAILASKGVHTNMAAFDYVIVLAEKYVHELCSGLASIARVQRRSQPSLEDVALLFTTHNIRFTDLEVAKQLSSKFTKTLGSLEFDPELEPVAEAAQPFFGEQVMQVHKIIPSQRRLPRHVPEWLPKLPPDHTYLETPKFSNQVSDLRVLRERLVEEGRLAEQALQRLLGEGGSESTIDLSKLASQPRVIHREPPAVANTSNGTANGTTKTSAGPDDPDPNAEVPESYITVIDSKENAQPQQEQYSNGNAPDIADGGEQRAEGNSADEPEPAKPLPALKIRLGKETQGKPFSLKISFGKSDAKESSLAPPPSSEAPEAVVPPPPQRPGKIFKRPRLDIEALAHKLHRGEGALAQARAPPQDNKPAQPGGLSLDAQLQQALASVQGD